MSTMYLCDPRKNTECSQTGCIYGLCSECFSTTKAQFAFRDRKGGAHLFRKQQIRLYVRIYEKEICKRISDGDGCRNFRRY